MKQLSKKILLPPSERKQLFLSELYDKAEDATEDWQDLRNRSVMLYPLSAYYTVILTRLFRHRVTQISLPFHMLVSGCLQMQVCM